MHIFGRDRPRASLPNSIELLARGYLRKCEPPCSHPGELRSAIGAAEPVGVVVDANGRLAAITPTPVPDVVVAFSTTLHAASALTVVLNQAPVLMLDRVLEPPLCAALVDHWQRGNKLVDGVASIVGANRADA